jgi:hypothetical protein
MLAFKKELKSDEALEIMKQGGSVKSLSVNQGPGILRAISKCSGLESFQLQSYFRRTEDDARAQYLILVALSGNKRILGSLKELRLNSLQLESGRKALLYLNRIIQLAPKLETIELSSSNLAINEITEKGLQKSASGCITSIKVSGITNVTADSAFFKYLKSNRTLFHLVMPVWDLGTLSDALEGHPTICSLSLFGDKDDDTYHTDC